MTKHQQLADSLIKNGKTKSWSEYGQEFGLSAEAARAVWKKVRKGEVKDIKAKLKCVSDILENALVNKINDNTVAQNYIADLEAQMISMSAEKNKAEATYRVKDEIKTLEELIEKCKIDTNVWNVEKYVQNFWAGNYQVKAFLVKKEVDTDLSLQKEMFLEEMRKVSTPSMMRTEIRDTNIEKNQLLELAVFDLHLGKLSWKEETGEDYDLEIASKRYWDCITDLVQRVQWNKIDRILLPLGNDMIHIDNKFKTTTNGTPQDTDSRFAKIIKIAKGLIISVIDNLSTIAPVDVVIVPGNHDQTVMFTLGEILDAFYYGSDRVKIFNSPKLRKYYQYGKNMIMYTHGSEEKHAELGLIAATEEPKMWAETKFREVHLGHLHKSKSVKYTNVDEFQGFKVRIINSLSGTDAWHYSKGYMSLKGAEAFVWDKEKGLITNHFYNL